MSDRIFSFAFSEKQLIALQDAAANHINPWVDEEDETLQILADQFSEALKARES